MALDLVSLRAWIRRQLGFPTVVVELTDDQIDDCVTAALEAYSSLLPTQKRLTVQGGAGIQRYTLAAGTYGRAVVDVEVELSRAIGGEIDIFDAASVMRTFGDPSMSGGYPDYAMQIQASNAAQLVLSADFEWDVTLGDDPKTDPGYLFVSPLPSIGRRYTLVCAVDHTPESIPSHSHRWAKDYALAHAMVVLGRIRRKFGQIQGTQTTLETDGAQLVQEGQERIDKLAEWLEQNKRSVMIAPIRG